MSEFKTIMQRNSWLGPVTGMFAVTGLLLGGALRSQERIREEQLPSGRAPEIVAQLKTNKQTIKQLNDEIGRLREKQLEYEGAMASGNKQTQVLRETLEELQVRAGMTAVKGPGIEVVLKDSKPRKYASPYELQNFIIHDLDILRVVNEMFAAGAEAVAVNGHRLIGGYSIRCSGPITNVNNVQIGQPFVIEAIGDPATLQQAIELTGGVLADIINTDKNMVQVSRKAEIILKGYEGGTQLKYAKPTKLEEAKAKEEAK